MSMMKEFREFAMKGNVLDLAVGVVIGAAFGKIVSSMVNDVIMPVVSLLSGGVDLTKKYAALDGKTYASIDEATKAGAAVLKYGNFIQTVIDFAIVAFAIFMMVKVVNSLRKQAPAEAAK